MLKILGVLIGIGAIVAPIVQCCYLCHMNPQTDEELLRKIKELESENVALKLDKQVLTEITKEVDTIKTDLHNRVS